MVCERENNNKRREKKHDKRHTCIQKKTKRYKTADGLTHKLSCLFLAENDGELKRGRVSNISNARKPVLTCAVLRLKVRNGHYERCWGV